VNYTSRLDDVVQLFQDLGRNDWADKARTVHPSMNRTAHPEVSSHCFYGSSINTSYSFGFPGSVADGEMITFDMNGDGNQDIIDNTFCQIWEKSEFSQKYKTVSQEFPGVHHMQMYSNDDVLAALLQVLEGQ